MVISRLKKKKKKIAQEAEIWFEKLVRNYFYLAITFPHKMTGKRLGLPRFEGKKCPLSRYIEVYQDVSLGRSYSLGLSNTTDLGRVM